MTTFTPLFDRAKRLAAGAILVAALAPAPALADQTAAIANRLALMQAIDCATTLSIIRAGGTEQDPLATPFVRSPLTMIAAAAGLNLVARRLPIRVLRMAVSVYPFVILGNARSVGARLTFASQVSRSSR